MKTHYSIKAFVFFLLCFIGQLSFSQNPFITTWEIGAQTQSSSKQLTIDADPNLDYNFDVDWENDGIYDDFGISSTITHEYSEPGIYAVAIRGNFPRFKNSGSLLYRLLSIDQWGDIKWSRFSRAFSGAHKMQLLATDSPDLSEVTDMSYMFSGCYVMNADLSDWDMSNIERIGYMFWLCFAFNGDITTWDVGRVYNMEHVFDDCHSFNQDISGWNVSRARTMNSMFNNCYVFDQELNDWDVSKVTDTRSMFTNCKVFNRDLSDWDVSNVERSWSMFAGCSRFNGDISQWDVSKMDYFSAMFSGCSDFNSDLSKWDVGNIIYFNSMFSGCRSFNADLSKWDVSAGVHMTDMFSNCSSFDSDISEWDVSKVWWMENMFYRASNFNADISGWKPKLSYASGMFIDATSFNQDLGDWDFSDVEDLRLFLQGSGLDCNNYASLLENWAQNPNIVDDLLVGVDELTYDVNGKEFRDSLINKGWIFLGDRLASCDPTAQFFISSWKTNNQGMSCDSCIIIPTREDLDYNYDIDWDNDGIFDEIGVEGDVEHKFPSNGTHQIVIRGQFPAIYFNNTGDKEKIQSIDQWGVIEWESMNKAFYGCTNLTTMANDQPNLQLVDDMSYMLSKAQSMNLNMGQWNISQVTDMTAMLDSSGLDCKNYSATLLGWVSNPICPVGVSLGAAGLTYDFSAIASRDSLLEKNWNIAGDEIGDCTVTPRPFVTTWKTDNPGESCESCITIPTVNGVNYNFDIDWENDGVYDEFGVNRSIIHDYGTPGTYTVAIRGDFPRISFYYEDDLEKIINVNQWGDMQWESMGRAFHRCLNLEVDATDIPDLSRVRDMQEMFFFCHEFDGDVRLWDVSNVLIMSDLFNRCYKFNRDVSLWDVSHVSTIHGMFSYCYEFDQDLDTWDVRGVEDMGALFSQCRNFNGNIDNWDVSNVHTMELMFYGCSIFNRDISVWDVSKVGGMRGMFSGCKVFNIDLGIWDVSSVGNMSNMFEGCEIFNQDLNSWDVSRVGGMREMFRDCGSFNKSLNSWDVSNVTTTLEMFYDCKSFNGNISDWNLESVRYVISMFRNCKLFNGDLSSWNFGSIFKSMDYMFAGCSDFNSNINNWDVSSTTSMEDMFLGCNQFSSDLSGWDVSNVKSMKSMFRDCTEFDSDLKDWDVSKVTDMEMMYRNCKKFDGDIIDWDVSNVTDMDLMFDSCFLFNQDIGAWDVDSVSNMRYMLSNTRSFDQNLGNWKLNSINSLIGFLDHSGIGCENYTNTLSGWTETETTPNDLFIGVRDIQYSTDAEAYRDLLIGKGWVFEGDIQSDCTVSVIDQTLELNIYPNPTSNVLNVETNNKVNINLFDITGKLIMSKTNNSNVIDLSGLVNGVYILEVSSDLGLLITRQKVIKI